MNRGGAEVVIGRSSRERVRVWWKRVGAREMGCVVCLLTFAGSGVWEREVGAVRLEGRKGMK